MCFSCSAVSVTLLAVVDCALSSLGEQPAKAATPAIATAVSASVRISDLFVMLFPGQLRTIPPPAAKRLKQRRRVGKAAGLRLQANDARLLVGLFGIQHGEIVGVTV